jgi:DNA-binding response OmpR family regulator
MKKIKILLVEPDHILASVYKEHLEKFNYDITVSPNVQKAINDIDKVHPDAIILEIQLNSHNGYEFLYELRSYSDLQDIPVLIHSMIPEADLGIDPQTKKELGIISFLYKPSTTLGKLHYELNKHFLVRAV